MYLYNLTLKDASVITHAIVGEFSGRIGDRKRPRYEIALAKGRILEIVRIDEQTGKVQTVINVKVFALIRSMAAFRLTGSYKDYLAIGSDSGRLIILEYLPDKGRFEKVHQETFGRSGCRRIVPGQYIACDSKGRAVMIGALEKQKLVYQLNRDTQLNLTISSPLEAHTVNTFVFGLINIDVGYENPLFACLEVEYEEADGDPSGIAAKKNKQNLTHYEVDLGLNHVVRKYTEQLEDFANLLIPVPGGNDGPSGVIVCSENYIVYKNFGTQKDLRCYIPRRKGETDVTERGILIASYAIHKFTKDDRRDFFFLLQTELGDVFKTELDTIEDEVIEIKMKYFCTLPVATQMCLIPQTHRHIEGGFLFVAVEAGNHLLLQIEQIDVEGQKVFSSKFMSKIDYFEADFDESGLKKFQFKHSQELINVVVIDEIQSLSPIISACAAESETDHQLILGCGSNKNSTLRVLRNGLNVTERAMSMLPRVPTGVWSLKKRCDCDFDEYIIVSFINATLVLGVEDAIEEILDSGFLASKRTLGCSQLGDDSLIQVHPEGIRHIYADKRVTEWRAPFKRQIVKCALNQRQVVVALSNNEILYFELDVTGQLNECNERKEFPSTISCMAIGEIAPGDSRSQFLAVGIDQKVCVISLDLNECMSEITRQTFSSSPESISIAELGGGKDFNFVTQFYLNVGLQNGELVRTRLDRVTGDLSEPVRRYLGIEPVKLCNVKVNGCQAVLANTNRSWLSYYHQGKYNLSPLCYETLDHAASFKSSQIGEGIVAVTSNAVRVLSFEELGDIYNQQSFPLEASPRKFVIHPPSGNVVAVLTDRQPLLIRCEDESDRWRSLIKLIDPKTGETLKEIKLESHQAALSLAIASFGTSSLTVHVGIVNDYKLRKQSFSSCEIHTYSISPQGTEFELLHVTACENIPRAMSAFEDRLAVGIGKSLRIYDLGKKKLLRKCESKRIANFISSISACGNRLFVSDIEESFTCMKYRKEENVLTVFADDTYPRWIVSAGLVDKNCIAGGDKFGNICILSLPKDVNDDLDDDPSGTKSLWDRGWLGGTSQKVENVATIHLGEIVSSIQRTALTPGRADCIVYTTICGTLGALIPFSFKDEFEFFQTLEWHLRSQDENLCGRNHLSFCSMFFPVKNIVDGDICQLFSLLDSKVQNKIAEDMEMEAGDINMKIDQIFELII